MAFYSIWVCNCDLCGVVRHRGIMRHFKELYLCPKCWLRETDAQQIKHGSFSARVRNGGSVQEPD